MYVVGGSRTRVADIFEVLVKPAPEALLRPGKFAPIETQRLRIVLSRSAILLRRSEVA